MKKRCTQMLTLKNPKNPKGPRIRKQCDGVLSAPDPGDEWGNEGKQTCPKCFSTYRHKGHQASSKPEET